MATRVAPSPEPPRASFGWVSPSGLFYPCGHGCHDDLATLIVESTFGSCRGRSGRLVLEEAGWLFVGPHPKTSMPFWPQPMLDTFGRILVAMIAAQDSGEDLNNLLEANTHGYRQLNTSQQPDAYGILIDFWSRVYSRESGEGAQVPAVSTRRIGDHPGD